MWINVTNKHLDLLPAETKKDPIKVAIKEILERSKKYKRIDVFSGAASVCVTVRKLNDEIQTAATIYSENTLLQMSRWKSLESKKLPVSFWVEVDLEN